MTKKPRKPSTPGSFRNVRTTNPPHQHIIKFRLRDNAWPPAKMLDFPFRKHEERVTFDDLVTDLKNDYQVNGKGSLKTVGYYLAHMRVFFGLDRAIDISPDK